VGAAMPSHARHRTVSVRFRKVYAVLLAWGGLNVFLYAMASIRKWCLNMQNTAWGYQIRRHLWTAKHCFILQAWGIRTNNTGKKKRFQLLKPEASAGLVITIAMPPTMYMYQQRRSNNLADNVSTKGCGGVCRPLLCVFLPTCAYFIRI